MVSSHTLVVPPELAEFRSAISVKFESSFPTSVRSSRREESSSSLRSFRAGEREGVAVKSWVWRYVDIAIDLLSSWFPTKESIFLCIEVVE